MATPPVCGVSTVIGDKVWIKGVKILLMSPPKRHFDVVFQLFAESHDAEPLCIFSALLWSDGLLRVEVFDGFDDAFFRLLREEAAGLAVFDGLEGAASAVGDDGCAAGLGFDWGDAEVFFGGE